MKNKATSSLLELTVYSPYGTLQKAVKEMCKHRSKEGNIGLVFSIYETSFKTLSHQGFDVVVKHPDIYSDAPVFEGNCVFFSDYWRISENQVDSEIMPNPRWSEIICEANRQLIDPNVGDTAMLFLEGFYEMDPRLDGTRVFELVWGS